MRRWIGATVLLVLIGCGLSAAPPAAAQPSIPSHAVTDDGYDGPGGIDGPGEYLCNIAPSKLPVLRIHTARHYMTKLLQAVLAGLKFKPGPVDGTFGSRTDAAVKRFQTAHQLIVDGVAGKQTWRALKHAYC